MTRTMPFLVAAALLAGCSSNDDPLNPIEQEGEDGSTSSPDDPAPTPTTDDTDSDSGESSGPSDDGSSTSDDGTTGDDGSSTGDPTTTGDDSTTGDETTGEGSSSTTDGETTGEPIEDTHQLYQGAFNGAFYEYGFDSIEIMDITGAPEDTDWTRWAMLHDGDTYRLYFMQEGTDDSMYQFGFNPATQDYEWGYDSIPQLDITGAPADADMSSFAMLHSGEYYHLYALSENDPLRVYQFLFNPATQDYEFGLSPAIPQIDVTDFPGATDFSGWGMLWENDSYRFYAFADGGHDAIAQASYNPSSGDYEWGYNSIPVIDVVGFPADSNTGDFAMLHDGDAFRFYMLRE